MFKSSVTAFCASPSTDSLIKSKSSPSSSEITLAPVKAAKSSSISLLKLEKPGGSITFTLILPLTLFITKADNTCCDTLPIINIALWFFIAYSNTACIFLIVDISESTNNIKGDSISILFFSLSVIKC